MSETTQQRKYMMNTVIALLALLASAVILAVPVEGVTDNTYVANQSTYTIVATTWYYFRGSSQFVNRHIDPGKFDHDEYGKADCEYGANYFPNPVSITLNVDGSKSSVTYVRVDCDKSIVAETNADNDRAVDIYLSAEGNIFEKEGKPLATLPVD